MCNLGMIDRVIRAVSGIAIIIWAITAASWWGLIGLVLLGTSMISFCPLYAILKINSGCKSGI